jgi:hypothetical protein
MTDGFEQIRRPTKRAPDAGDSAAFSSIFLRLSFFVAGRLRRPRPSAGNASRWLANSRACFLPNTHLSYARFRV